jgi:ABC-type dipeptide/oligopeptide/nickel transport system permease subunit
MAASPPLPDGSTLAGPLAEPHDAPADVGVATEAAKRRPTGPWRDALRNVRHQRSAMIGLAILVTLALIAILAPVIAPHEPNATFIGELGAKARAAPCIHLLGCPVEQPEHFFGLDGNFRDLYTRVIYGGRISLIIGFFTVGLAILIGAVLGAIAGYAGGRLDAIIMRLMDILLVFPALLLAIAIVTVMGKSLFNALLAIALVAIPIYARIARASVLTVREQDFVTASRALGESSTGILVRRVLPNSLTPIIVAGTLGIGTAVLDVAALSFLGLGADIRTPEWGAMIGMERNNVFNAPHLLIFPAIALTLTVLAFNLLGDGVRDALDPRLNR